MSADQVATSTSMQIPGGVGSLEAAVDSSGGAPSVIAVVCHPHPLQEGTMQNKVVTTVARAFVRLGAAAVRFNFRGVGTSAGSYADGIGERDDALAVIAWSRDRWPGLPLYLCGFSFGAAIAIAIAARVAPAGLVSVAPAIDRLPADLVPPACPWLLVHGAADEVVPAEPVLAWCATLPSPPRIVLMGGAGHFFHGRLPARAAAVDETFGPVIRGSG